MNRYKHLSDWCYFFGLTPLLALLPRNTGYGLIRRQARRVRLANRVTSIEVDRHISLVLDDEQWSVLAKTETADRSFEAVVAEDLDTLYFPFWNERNIARYFGFEGLEKIDRIRRLRKGALLFTGNFGSVSSALVALALRGYTLNHVCRDPRMEGGRNPALHAFSQLKLALMRRKTEREMLFVAGQASYTHMSASRSILDAYRLLAMNELVSLVLDVPPQLARETAKVEFLGRECTFPTGLIRLAHHSKAPVVPFFSFRDGQDLSQQKVIVQDPVPMSGKTEVDLQRCVDRLAKVILEHPDQWRGWPALNLFWTGQAAARETAA